MYSFWTNKENSGLHYTSATIPNGMYGSDIHNCTTPRLLSEQIAMRLKTLVSSHGTTFFFILFLQAILQAVVHGYCSPNPYDVVSTDVELGGAGNGSGYNRTAMPTQSATMTDYHQQVVEAEEACYRKVLSKPYPNDGKLCI